MVQSEQHTDTYFATDYEDAVRYIEHCEQFEKHIAFVDWTRNQVTTDEQVVEKLSNEIKITRPGAFRKDGEVYIVKPNRERTRMYARKLVIAPSERLTATGETVKFEFKYARGAIYKLTEADRLSEEEAEQYMIQYGRCIMCGRRLKVASSIKAGMGPICAKYFRGEY